MTEPDEALLWARERAAQWQDEGGGEAGSAYRRGGLDFLLGEEVEGYRAGAAASEARIKVLEAALADTLSGLNYIREFHGTLYGVGWERFKSYRALLKEGDQ